MVAVTREQEVWRATGMEKPVFLDERGRRRRLVRLGGALAVLLVTAWLALIVAGPLGFARLPGAVLPRLVHHARIASLTRHGLRAHILPAHEDEVSHSGAERS